MPCPVPEKLAKSLARYRAAGADHIVSMLPDTEAEALGLRQEPDLSSAAGMSFTQHAIPDFGLPQMQHFVRLIRQIDGWLHQGLGVTVHCKAGIGRSGMVGACLMVAQGCTASQAMEKVSAARGLNIPDTVEQGRFIEAFARKNSN